MYRKRGNPSTEVKDLLGAGATKVLDKKDGIIEAIVSVTGIVDEVEDVITPGCYGKTLATIKPKGIRSHDWDRFAMKTLNSAELHPGSHELPEKTRDGSPWPREAGALKVLMQWNLETKDGSEGFSNVRFLGPEQEWSIGYNVPRNGSRMVKGVRHITDIVLYEYSDVLFGAAPNTGTVGGVKSGGLTVMGGGLWTPDGYDGKALPGSDEERREALETALNAAFRAEYPDTEDGGVYGYQMIRGTFVDRVVVCFNARDERQDYEYQYSYDGTDVVLGDRRAVKVEEVLTADVEDEGTPLEGVEAKLTADELLLADNLRSYVG